MRFNMQVVLLTAVSLVLLSLSSIEAWRRRRRTVVKITKDVHERRRRDVLSSKERCLVYGEYSLRSNQFVPTDSKGAIANGLLCNNQYCWKGHYCWNCRRKDGGADFIEVPAKQIHKIECKDVQCLVGKHDSSLDYYSRNDSRSVPLAAGPFSCNSYLCMSNDKCWKCRLNYENEDFETVTKGQDFENRVTCCPIPTRLFQVDGESFQEVRYGSKVDGNEEELENVHLAIFVKFSSQKLVTGIKVTQEEPKSSEHYCIAYSANGTTWTDYREFESKRVFTSNKIPNQEGQTLFKPFIATKVKIIPHNHLPDSRLSVALFGCDIH